ncbi:MAG: DUF2939 domain-containing protein [Phenylobacterium sp.]|uniref:DUF2939 domain-containing protein n=1 Tax=Phenylobacterium sp. TaxID=1871053 RepID=UPI0025DE9008|nr:DUF2939 domain-containing protein [Phenylobacterium sp.]MCA6224540.1 DUF2939 domain-containing protein [Phenylobacterium sp.]MCA6227684.1 DUF2939 domain-containing protein [Phenylobacterium sp.]MCA6248463.1 DUF2939 domain-containing protein [Phenylobacterium sp.]MCA6251273.1 DUF2939 domain-containing protein [Phenylobacterium sp.]MCA6259272.1 DUF2939 domain-containing protein [Phenylobacterium sp.]
MLRRLVLFGLLGLLAACATANRLDAASDVHALLVAIRDEDRTAFDARVDREALKAEIASRLARETSRLKIEGLDLGRLGAVAAPALASFAGDTLIQPRVFRQVAEAYGYSRDKPLPGTVAIASRLKAMPDGRVCATVEKDGSCVLIFTRNAEGRWRLSGFEGDLSSLKIRL